jgi:tetratricopeptide (TPR) repeat protein
LDDLKLVKHASRSLAAVAMRRAGQTFVLLGDDRKAEEVLNRSMDFEDAAATHLDLCAAYLAAKKPSDCLTETGKVILRDPQNAAAWRIQSEAWKMEGDSAHAESSRKQADSLPDNPQGLPDPLIGATKLSPAQRTKLKAEQSDLAKIIANALNDLGTTEARESNFTLALTHFHEAEQWQPALPGLMRNVGLASARVQDYPDAARALRKVIAADPSDELARTILGSALFSTNAFAEAIQVFSPLGDSALPEPGVAYAWVESLIKLNRFRQASTLLDKWQQLSLTPDTYILIAQARSQMGDYPHAVAACRRALEIDPKTPKAHYIAALALLHDGHSREAEADLRSELELDPNNEETQYNLAFVLLQQSRAEEAVPWLERVVAQDPNHAQANYELGKQLLSDGKTEEAAKYLEVAARLTPQLAHVHYQLQSAYRSLGRRADADRELKLYKEIKERTRDLHTPNAMQ